MDQAKKEERRVKDIIEAISEPLWFYIRTRKLLQLDWWGAYNYLTTMARLILFFSQF